MTTANDRTAARLEKLWDRAAKTGNADAIRELRTAFEIHGLALDAADERKVELAIGRARRALGSVYFTTSGKRRTSGGRPVYQHTGSFGIDAWACRLEGDNVLSELSGCMAEAARARRERPLSWATTERNCKRRARALHGEALRRGLLSR